VPLGIVMVSMPSSEVASTVSSISPSLLMGNLVATPKRFVQTSGGAVGSSSPDGAAGGAGAAIVTDRAICVGPPPATKVSV